MKYAHVSLAKQWIGDWTEPWDSEDPKDREACDRKIEFAICWFGDPVYFGKYPESMRKQLGDRLPEFTAEEAALVKGSNDFYGMNHYCANYIRHKDTEPELDDFVGNMDILYQNKKGEWIGPETQSVWLRPYPLGFRKLIKWLSDRYGGPTFYVTENGTSLKNENELPLEQLLDDEFRCEYFRGYIGALADAHTKDGVDVRGYSAWSLMEYVNKYFPFIPKCLRHDGSEREQLDQSLTFRCAICMPGRSLESPSSTHQTQSHPQDAALTSPSAVTLNGPKATQHALVLRSSTTRADKSGIPRRVHARFQRFSASTSKRSD